MKIFSIQAARQRTGVALWILFAGLLGTGCVDAGLEAEPESETATAQGLSDIPDAGSETAVTGDEQGPNSSPSPDSFVGACVTHQGHTVGWMDCTGGGTVRLTVDCKAPQINDFVSNWVTFSGSITISGECVFGINLVKFDSK